MCWNSPYSVYNKWSFGIHCHASFNMWYSAVATCNYLSLFLLLHTEKRSMIYWYIYTNVLNSNNHGNLLATSKTDRWNNFDKYDFKKVDDFLAVSYYFPYYILLYIYMHNVEIKSLILNSLSKGSKHKKVDIKSSHQRWLLTQWLSRQKEWATFVVDVIIYKVTAIQMRKFSSRYHFSLKIDLYLQNRINFDTSKLSMRTPPPPSKKNLTSMERAINPFLVVEILIVCWVR